MLSCGVPNGFALSDVFSSDGQESAGPSRSPDSPLVQAEASLGSRPRAYGEGVLSAEVLI